MKARKNKRERSEQMHQVSAGLRDMLGMTQWRKAHPHATWAEIEAAVDKQINQLRAQLLQDIVQLAESEGWSEMPEEERPKCATCDKPLWARGEQTRFIQTTGGEAVKLTRTYGTCPACGVGFFPLDEQLGLSSGGLTPRGEETLVRLASWMPFEPAGELLEDLLGVRVSKATGKAALAVCEREQERLKQEAPQAPAGAGKQAMSGDGAFVLLVDGEWVEVKTLTIGEVTRNSRGEVCLEQISSLSRQADAEHFAEAALVETHRRGVDQAPAVCAVQDGAEWLQGLVDYHRVDAVRILDFAHAAEYVNEIGRAVRAAGGRLPAKWLEGVLHRLKHQGPARVLKHLGWLAARYLSPAIQEKLTYLQKREAHMQDPTYQEAGWPIGSGSVESANKLVVEARLKGAGMRLPATEHQSRAGTAQWGLQSAVERDMDGSRSSSASGAHESAAGRRPTAADQRLLAPRFLGSAPVSAVPSTCFPLTGEGPRRATSSSSWLWLFLAQAFSQTPSLQPCGFRRSGCKKMNRTPYETLGRAN